MAMSHLGCVFAALVFISRSQFDGHVKCNETLTGEWDDWNDIDNLYLFNLSTASKVIFDSCGSSYDTVLYLNDTDGPGYLYWTDDAGDCGDRAILSISSLEAGEYILGVSGWWYFDGGPFIVRVFCDETTTTAHPTVSPTTAYPTVSPITIYVNINNQLPIQNQTGLSWSFAFTDLQSALQIANENDEIWIAKGIYYPTQTDDRGASFYISQNGLSIYGAFVGNETSPDQRMSKSFAETILSGNIANKTDNKDNSNNVVKIFSTNDVLFDSITISDGYEDLGSGSGMLVNQVDILYIYNCFFTNNFARNGAAIDFYETWKVNIQQSVFTNNSASSLGGAIHVWQADDIFIGKSTFISNTAASGGAIEIWWPDYIIIQNCTFKDNKATGSGGALKSYYVSAGTRDIYIVDSIFAYNVAGYDGGAIYVEESYNIIIKRTTLTGNSAGHNGGGISLLLESPDKNNDVTIHTSVFTSNSADIFGGAICAFNITNITIQNSNITDNTVRGHGGGIYSQQNQYVTITESILRNNNANDNGGAMYINQSNIIGLEYLTVVQNTALQKGSGLYLFNNSETNIRQCYFRYNFALFGAIFIQSKIDLLVSQLMCTYNSGGCFHILTDEEHTNFSIEESIFKYNTATISGAAINIFPITHSPSYVINNSSFSQNNAPNGGAIAISDRGNIITCNNISSSIINTKFINNRATVGGAFFLSSVCPPTIIQCRFSNNIGYNGGAFAIDVISSISQHIMETQFISNSAIYNGGSIYSDQFHSISLNDCIFSSNQCGQNGGSIFLQYLSHDMVFFKDCLLFNN
eukprot:180000_1